METTTYLNFDLLIQRVGQDYRARVQNSPVGETSEPFNSADLAALSAFVGPNRQDKGDPISFGGQLYRAVFHGQVGNCLARSLDAAQRERKGLRIRLRLNEVPELAGLPWEYLHDPTNERSFILSDQTPIVRYLEMQCSQQPLELARPLRILMVIANPYDFAPLNVEEEWRKVEKALSDLQQRGFVVVERLQQATFAALQKQLRQETYHILHFIGHGWVDNYAKQSGLVLEDAKKSGHLVPASVLGTLLHDHRSLRLVLLNACQGAQMTESNPFAGTAQHLVQQGLPSVIAMQFPISDQAAIALTHEFYRALADGYPVDAALAEARKAIYGQQRHNFEWGTPVLFMRAPDGHLFETTHSNMELMTVEFLPKYIRSDSRGELIDLEIKVHNNGNEEIERFKLAFEFPNLGSIPQPYRPSHYVGNVEFVEESDETSIKKINNNFYKVIHQSREILFPGEKRTLDVGLRYWRIPASHYRHLEKLSLDWKLYISNNRPQQGKIRLSDLWYQSQ